MASKSSLKSLVYLAATRVYSLSGGLPSTLPSSVEEDNEVGRARISHRNAILHAELHYNTLELWIVLVPMAFKHATLSKTCQLERDWKGSVYEIGHGAMSSIYNAILNTSMDIWIYFGRICVVRTRGCISKFIAIDKVFAFDIGMATPRNPYVVYIY